MTKPLYAGRIYEIDGVRYTVTKTVKGLAAGFRRDVILVDDNGVKLRITAEKLDRMTPLKRENRNL